MAAGPLATQRPRACSGSLVDIQKLGTSRFVSDRLLLYVSDMMTHGVWRLVVLERRDSRFCLRPPQTPPLPRLHNIWWQQLSSLYDLM